MKDALWSSRCEGIYDNPDLFLFPDLDKIRKEPAPTFTDNDWEKKDEDKREEEIASIQKFCRYLCHKYLELLDFDVKLFDAPTTTPYIYG